jgi:hypothetical protein
MSVYKQTTRPRNKQQLCHACAYRTRKVLCRESPFSSCIYANNPPARARRIHSQPSMRLSFHRQPKRRKFSGPQGLTSTSCQPRSLHPAKDHPPIQSQAHEYGRTEARLACPKPCRDSRVDFLKINARKVYFILRKSSLDKCQICQICIGAVGRPRGAFLCTLCSTPRTRNGLG